MSNENAFTRILSRLDESDPAVTEKTASVQAVQSVEARMLEQVRAVSDSTAKTASANAPAAPASDLASMAKSAQASEQAQLTKQAQFMGAAIADGFMTRFAAYDTALSEQGVKVAAVAPIQTAPANGQVKEAAQAGYQQAVVDMEKRANAQYEQGYKDQLTAIHKTAAEIHYAGQMVAHNLVEQARQAQ